VQRIAHGNVDEPVLAANWHRGLRPRRGQGKQTRPWPPPRIIASVSADISMVVCAKEPPPREKAGSRGDRQR
jgi:hypothetical protein